MCTVGEGGLRNAGQPPQGKQYLCVIAFATVHIHPHSIPVGPCRQGVKGRAGHPMGRIGGSARQPVVTVLLGWSAEGRARLRVQLAVCGGCNMMDRG